MPKLWWCHLLRYLSLKGRFPKPLWDQAAPIALSMYRGDFPCTEQGWGVEISLLLPDWVEWVSVVLKCEARDFSSCLVKTLSPFSALSMSWCAHGAQPGSLPRFPLGPQKQPGCTSRGSGFTGCSFGITSCFQLRSLLIWHTTLCRHTSWLFCFPALGLVHQHTCASLQYLPTSASVCSQQLSDLSTAMITDARCRVSPKPFPKAHSYAEPLLGNVTVIHI